MKISAKHKLTGVTVLLTYDTLKEAQVRTKHYLTDYEIIGA